MLVALEVKQFSSTFLKSIFDKKFSLFYLSLIINLIIHLIIGLSYYNPVDFVLQVEAAKKIAQGNLLYRDIGEIVVNGFTLQKPQYPPLYLYTLGSLIALVGVDSFTWQMAKLFLIIVNLIVGVLLFYITKLYTNSHPKSNFIALSVLNFFLLNPATLGVVFGGYHDNFMILFVLIGFIMFKKASYSLSGLFFGLALLVKPLAGIYMIPILLWGIHSHNIKSIYIWILAGITFFIGSLPFLLIVPEIYLNDVFFIHAQRPDPSMSFYTYFFSEISTTMIPFLVQSVFLLIFFVFLVKKVPIVESKTSIEAVLPFMAIFLATNRILYPHYIPFIFPFLTLNLFFLLADYYSRGIIRTEIYSVISLIIGLILIYIGVGGFGILWSFEKYETYTTNPLFLISSIICISGLILVSLISLYLLSITINKGIGKIHDERLLQEN